LADEGNAEAQFNVDMLYYSGVGAPQDYAQAALWFRKAADQGQANAEAFLGKVHVDGQGVRQDYAQALIWLREAASPGGAVASPFSARRTPTAEACRWTMFRLTCGSTWRPLAHQAAFMTELSWPET
jgi:TPR repeat protein